MQQESELSEHELVVKNLTLTLSDCGSTQADAMSSKQAEAAAECSGVRVTGGSI